MSDSQTTITRKESPGGGQYQARVADAGGVGVLDYRLDRDGNLVALHTEVPGDLRGRGIGQALVARLVADARAAGVGIVPRCPFVRARLEQDPSSSDLIV